MAGVTRNLIMGIDPYREQGEFLGEVTTISYYAVPDGNNENKCFTCAYVPPSRGSGIAIVQETMFLGTNAEVGLIYHTFVDRAGDGDGGGNVRAEFITVRIDPDLDEGKGESTTKRYATLDFSGPNLLDYYNTTLSWTKDCNPVEDVIVTWTDFIPTIRDTQVFFEKGLANWIHLKGVSTGQNNNKILLGGFTVRYNRIGKGAEGRDS